MFLIAMKIIFLFLAVCYGFSNIGKIIYGQDVETANVIWMAIGIVGFIVIQFGLYK